MDHTAEVLDRFALAWISNLLNRWRSILFPASGVVDISRILCTISKHSYKSFAQTENRQASKRCCPPSAGKRWVHAYLLWAFFFGPNHKTVIDLVICSSLRTTFFFSPVRWKRERRDSISARINSRNCLNEGRAWQENVLHSVVFQRFAAHEHDHSLMAHVLAVKSSIDGSPFFP
jgi:hypothetical protein